jgi:hypothetical protein
LNAYSEHTIPVQVYNLNIEKFTEPNGSVNGNTPSASVPKPSPAALGLGPDDDLHLVVPDQLKQLVETGSRCRQLGVSLTRRKGSVLVEYGASKDTAFTKGLRRLSAVIWLSHYSQII